MSKIKFVFCLFSQDPDADTASDKEDNEGETEKEKEGSKFVDVSVDLAH